MGAMRTWDAAQACSGFNTVTEFRALYIRSHVIVPETLRHRRKHPGSGTDVPGRDRQQPRLAGP
jgi:hypothetical protein